jgi:hypothetical protein
VFARAAVLRGTEHEARARGLFRVKGAVGDWPPVCDGVADLKLRVEPALDLVRRSGCECFDSSLIPFGFFAFELGPCVVPVFA